MSTVTLMVMTLITISQGVVDSGLADCLFSHLSRVVLP